MNFSLRTMAQAGVLLGFGWIGAAQAGLVLSDPKQKPLEHSYESALDETARKEIEADPEVLTEEDAPTPKVEVVPSGLGRATVRRKIVSESEIGKKPVTLQDARPSRNVIPSLNELQLLEIQRERRTLAQTKTQKKAQPAAKVAPMKTEVIEEPLTRTKKTSSVPTQDSFKESAHLSDEPSAAFAYTHLLPSPLNIPGGTFILGTSVAMGVTDFLQISTNVIRDFTRYWNIQAKVPIIEYPTFVASAFVDWDTFNLNNFDESNPDIRVTSWQPGLVTGFELNSDMALFVGGNFNATTTHVPEVRTSGFAHGARLETDWSWLYNPQNSRLADNAISAGVAYDFTYKLTSFGVTHHWPSFQFGLHYTLNADNYRLMPIFNISSGFSF